MLQSIDNEIAWIILQRSADGVFVMDAVSGKFLEVSPSASSSLGYSRSELLSGMAVKDIEAVIPDDLSWARHVKEFKEHGFRTMEGTHKRRDGTTFPVEVTVGYVPGANGNFVVAFVRDISVRRKTEETLKFQEQSLFFSSKMAALGEMAGGVAHEINTPLSVIMMLSSQCSDLLEALPPDLDKIRNNLAKVNDTSERIAKIVRGLRTFSRDGSQDDMRDVSVAKIVGESMDFCQERFRSKGIQVTLDDFDCGLTFTGRGIEISQVLLNLLNNACDAVATLEEKWIHVTSKREDGWIVIAVTDSGFGLPVEIRGKLFQPFFTTKEVGKGIGLSLSISAKLVANCGGQLTVDYTCKNTRFCIRLPEAISINETRPA